MATPSPLPPKNLRILPALRVNIIPAFEMGAEVWRGNLPKLQHLPRGQARVSHRPCWLCPWAFLRHHEALPSVPEGAVPVPVH